MFRSSKKFGRFLVTPILITIILLVGLLVAGFRNQMTSRYSQISSSEKSRESNWKPSLSANYEIKDLDSRWKLLVSEDMGFEIKIPKDSWVEKGGGYNGVDPDTETAQLSINFDGSKANLVIVVETGKNLYKDEKEALEGLSKDTAFGFVYSDVNRATLRNAAGYEVYAKNDRAYKYIFRTTLKDKYLEVWYYYPWHGAEKVTSNEKAVAEEVIGSFMLLN